MPNKSALFLPVLFFMVIVYLYYNDKKIEIVENIQIKYLSSNKFSTSLVYNFYSIDSIDYF